MIEIVCDVWVQINSCYKNFVFNNFNNNNNK